MGAAQTKEPSIIAEQCVTGGAGSIHRAFVRERDKTANLEDFYEIVEEIGRGGLCAVFKIRKKQSKIGGTSRSDNVKAVPRWASPLRRKSTPVMAASNSRTALNKLGEGNFARAHSDGSTQHELYFAMKEINLALVAPEKVEQLKYEVEILKALDHKNIIKAYETFQASKKVLIVMELCNGGDLHSQFPYTEARAAQIARQILSAVSYMHSASIIHRKSLPVATSSPIFSDTSNNRRYKAREYHLREKPPREHRQGYRFWTLGQVFANRYSKGTSGYAL